MIRRKSRSHSTPKTPARAPGRARVARRARSADATQNARPSKRTSKSGYFYQRQLRPGELPGIMKKHILTGAMAGVWGNLITGIVYIYFGNAIGMSRLQWGILGAVSTWVVAAQPLGAMIGERAGSRKAVWFWLSICDRALRFSGIVGSYLLWRAGHPLAYLVMISAVCGGALVGNMANPPWFGWLARIIPRDVHGAFWGRRDSWVALAIVAAALPSGLIMDLIPPESKLGAAVMVLSAASLIGFMDLILHGTIPEPPVTRAPASGLFADFLKPLRDRRFRPWLVFTIFWNFAMTLGGSLANLYFMENLGFKNNLLGGMIATSVVGLLGIAVAARSIGRMVDRIGVQRMLMLGFFFWALLPAIWLLATPRSAVFWISVSSFVGGVFPAAANNAATKLVTRFPPPNQSSMYMAISSMIGSIAGGLGSLVAGSFLQAIGSWSFSLGGLVISGFPLLFMASALLRMTSTLVFVPRIREKGAPPEDRQPMLLPLFFGLPRIIRDSLQGEKGGGGSRGR